MQSLHTTCPPNQPRAAQSLQTIRRQRAHCLRASPGIGTGRMPDSLPQRWHRTATAAGFAPRTAAISAASRGAGRGKSTSSAALTVGVAKYRDPATGKTWTGRGKPPTWIAGVKDRDAFLIGNDAASGAQEANGASKRRARQAKPKASNIGVPKYRDAATGKTWTGRGKPPLWIVGAKNRDDYLIKAE